MSSENGFFIIEKNPKIKNSGVSLTEQCIPGAQVSTFESVVWFAAHAASSSSYVHTKHSKAQFNSDVQM